MLKYRALLVDTEKDYRRPLQQFFMDIEQAQDWAKRTLAGASKTAYVEFYRQVEERMYSLNWEDFADDKATVTNLQKAPEAAG